MASDKKNKRLQELRGSDFEIAKGQPDIRGWEVRDDAGRKLGKVSELIFDARDRKVRYMIVNVLDSKDLQLEKRTVLVPIGLALLDTADDDVILQKVTPFQLRALPKYDKDLLGPQAERDISVVFGREHTATALTQDNDLNTDFYQNELFDENNMYRNRRSGQVNMDDEHNRLDRLEQERLENLRRHEEQATQAASNNTLAEEERLRAEREREHRGETDEEYIRRARKNLDN